MNALELKAIESGASLVTHIERDKELRALQSKIENYKLRIAEAKRRLKSLSELTDLELLKQALRETAKEL